MIPVIVLLEGIEVSIPRESGDDPQTRSIKPSAYGYSPRERG